MELYLVAKHNTFIYWGWVGGGLGWGVGWVSRGEGGGRGAWFLTSQTLMERPNPIHNSNTRWGGGSGR